MKVVLDTHIFILGTLHPESQERTLLGLLTKHRQARLVFSVPITDEILRKLIAYGVDHELMTSDDLFDLMKFFVRALPDTVLVRLTKGYGLVIEDKEDNKFVDAAIEGNADYLISNDPHILRLKGKGIRRSDGELLDIRSVKEMTLELASMLLPASRKA